MRCSVWREFAEQVAGSLHKGTRVIAQGRLKQRSYEKDGATRTVIEMEIDEIGPSLRYATAQVTRVQKGQGGAQQGGHQQAPAGYGPPQQGAPQGYGPPQGQQPPQGPPPGAWAPGPQQQGYPAPQQGQPPVQQQPQYQQPQQPQPGYPPQQGVPPQQGYAQPAQYEADVPF